MTCTKTYPGDRRYLSLQYRDAVTGDAKDPTVVSVWYVSPTGAQYSAVVTRTATGAYQAVVDIPDTESSTGKWQWKSKAEGAVADVEYGSIDVTHPLFTVTGT